MKTPIEILKEKGIDDKLEIDTSKPFPKGLRRITSEAMKEYAKQWVEEAFEVATASNEIGSNVGDAVLHLLKEIDAQ